MNTRRRSTSSSRYRLSDRVESLVVLLPMFRRTSFKSRLKFSSTMLESFSGISSLKRYRGSTKYLSNMMSVGKSEIGDEGE